MGGPITPLPGALLLATPFVLLGSVALQNVLWLGVFFLLARALLADSRAALLLLWCVLAMPVVLHELATGGDLFANGVYVATFMLLLVGRVPRPGASIRGNMAAAIILGRNTRPSAT